MARDSHRTPLGFLSCCAGECPKFPVARAGWREGEGRVPLGRSADESTPIIRWERMCETKARRGNRVEGSGMHVDHEDRIAKGKPAARARPEAISRRVMPCLSPRSATFNIG